VVWCPDWPVTAAGLEADAYGAVVEGSLVAACSAAARAVGVRRGQRVRDAQRHCPDLVIRERDPDAEWRLFESVAAAVAAVGPWVEVVRPGVCAVPVRGAHRGEESLRIQVQDAVVERGFDCGAGIADGLFAAELAARAGDGGTVVPEGGTAAFLAPYPVAVLDRPELADLLTRLGIRNLGAFAALPARQVAGRFGADELRAHRLARGLDARPPVPRPPAADLDVTMEFDPPAVAAEQVVFAAKALAERLREALAAEGLTCVRLGVEVTGADGRALRRLWRHDGTPSAAAVAERVRWQLSSWRTSPPPDGAPPGAPPSPDEEGVGGVVSLRLVPDQLARDRGRQEALWGGAAVTETIERAATRIQAMLGHDAVTRPWMTNGRGPGDRVLRVPFGTHPPGHPHERKSDPNRPPARPGGDPTSIVQQPAAPWGTERASVDNKGPGHRRDRRTAGPWPGRVPDPAPAVVHSPPVPVEVVDAAGEPVVVDERCVVSAPPRQVRIAGRVRPVSAWTGPWPARERWWDPARARSRFRFQMVTDDGRAYLLTLEGKLWHAEATYD
jgi:protein ImuB